MQGLEVYLPQDYRQKSGKKMFNAFIRELNSVDVVVAVLEGADADSGTCWECGYAFAKDIPIIGIRTDFRKTGDIEGFNAMLYFSATSIINGGTMQISSLANKTKKIINRLK